MPRARHFEGRRGLPRTATLLGAREPIRVAYLGGSITSGAGASNPDLRSYRPRLTEWLRQRALAVEEVNAAVGGTGSPLGVFRLEDDVLCHRPDVIVVEFAVNDVSHTRDHVLRAMEGIARKAAAASPAPDICLVYSLARADVETWATGGLPQSVQWHEEMAVHYSLPSIFAGATAVESLRDGSLPWATYAVDDVHPTDDGYRFMFDAISSALEAILEHPAADPERLVSPIAADNWQGAHLASLKGAGGVGWSLAHRETLSEWERFPTVIECTEPGHPLTLEFEGGSVGIYYEVGPTSGDVCHTIDGGAPEVTSLFDRFAPLGWRPHYRLLADHLAPRLHSLSLEAIPAQGGDAHGTQLRIGALLLA